MTLREKLEAWAAQDRECPITLPDGSVVTVIAQATTEEMLDLLWPVIECLQGYATADDEPDAPINQAAREALAKLEQDLK